MKRHTRTAILASCLWGAIHGAAAASNLTRKDLEPLYRDLERQYQSLERQGVDLGPTQALRKEIERAKKAKDWERLGQKLAEFGSLLDALAPDTAKAGISQNAAAEPSLPLAPLAPVSSSPASTFEPRLIESLGAIEEFRTLLRFRAHKRLMDPHGAVGRNREGFSNIAAQRDALWLSIRAIALADGELAGNSVSALEYAFAHQTAEGNFRNTLGVSARQAVGADAFFMQAFAHISLLIESSVYKDQYSARLAALKPNARKAMTWLRANTDELVRQDRNATNRLGFDALAFLLNGVLLNDQALVEQGKVFLRKALAAQRSDGVFVEHGGYDSSYQATTVLTLATAWMYLDDPALKTTIYRALEKAMDWEKTRILTNGQILISGNTRTGLGQEKLFGKVKDVNYPEVALAFYLWSRMSGDKASEDIARQITNYIVAARDFRAR